MKRFVTILSVLSTVLCVHAQEDKKNYLKQDSVSLQVKPEVQRMEMEQKIEPVADFQVDLPNAEQPSINPQAISTTPVFFNPYLLNWKGGGISGYNGFATSPFMYGYNAGGIIGHQFGNFAVTGNLSLSKAMLNGVGAVNGIGGNASLTYIANRNLSVTAIGGVSQYGYFSPLPSATTAYYGGYFTLKTNNEKWGIDLGAREVYNGMTGHWEMVPIVMPYFNLAGNKIGFDFGGLLREALFDVKRDAVIKQSEQNGRGPAIIPPPIDMKPRMKPTEMPKSMGDPALK